MEWARPDASKQRLHWPCWHRQRCPDSRTTGYPSTALDTLEPNRLVHGSFGFISFPGHTDTLSASLSNSGHRQRVGWTSKGKTTAVQTTETVAKRAQKIDAPKSLPLDGPGSSNRARRRASQRKRVAQQGHLRSYLCTGKGGAVPIGIAKLQVTVSAYAEG